MNKLWIVVGLTVITLTSCITGAQFNNAEDDVYYSPKANKKNPVMIPDVDVDEIMRKNPTQYGQPTNRVDDATTNPYAEMGYPAYKAQQDSLYQQYPELSGYYVNPSLMNSEQDEQARRLRNMYSGSYNGSGSWNTGLGISPWGPSFSIGYSTGFGNYGNYGGYGGYYGGYGGYGGYGNYYSPYNSWYSGYGPGWNMGWNSGWGWNGGWGSPYFGFGWGGYPYYWGGYYPYYGNIWHNHGSSNNGGGGDNSTPGPIERPRPSVGSNNPPASGNGGGSGGGVVNQNPQMIRTPSTNPATNNPAPGSWPTVKENPNMTRPLPGTNTMVPADQQTRPYTPPQGAARLENINGRPVYTAPAPSQQMRPDGGSMAPSQQQFASPQQQQPQRMRNPQQQNYQNQAPMFSPSAPPQGGGGGGRSVGGGGGGGRSSGGGGGGGVQRPR